MKSRDLDFIESRLLAPCVAAGDAHERLVGIPGYENQARKLMEAIQEFTDKCRDIRMAVVIIDQTSRRTA